MVLAERRVLFSANLELAKLEARRNVVGLPAEEANEARSACKRASDAQTVNPNRK